jgi:hypothetical protein
METDAQSYILVVEFLHIAQQMNKARTPLSLDVSGVNFAAKTTEIHQHIK